MDWKAALNEILAERRQQLGERPSDADLVALRAGELSDEERERLLERAAVDPEVARQLFDVLRFPEASEDDEDDEGVGERWQTLRRRLVAEGDLPRERLKPARPRRAWLALAATFVLGVSTALLFQRVRGPVDPPVNLAIVELLPVDETAERRGTTAVQVDADTGGLVLTLAVPNLFPSASAYTLEIGSTSTVGGLRPGVGGVFVLVLPRDAWGEGVHELRLKDNGGEVVARFQMEVRLRP